MLSLRKLASWAICTSLALFCLSGTLSAQQVFGSIFGTVTDPTGAAVSGAKVTIADTQKGTKFETTTNESGNYTKGQLIPGSYIVSIEASGFTKAVSSPITVQVDYAARYDAKLSVGNVTQEVEVTAAAPLLQSDRADVAQTFDSHQIEELPSVGRNLQAYELLNPGTVPFGWAHASDENPQGSVQMVVNGQVFDAMGYELDGTTNQDPILGIIVINPTFDSVAEVKQANQDFDAEFSYTGAGLATYSTKSGTNEYHGDAFEYLQVNTPGFQDFGRNPFTNANPVYRQNQWGGSIGGKVIKDKLFFFLDSQENHQAQGGSVNTSVPTALNRTGNFSDWLAVSPKYTIYDPSTGSQTDGTGRTPFPNNTIPQNELSSQALALLQYWPLPNTSQFGTVGNNYDASGDVAITGYLWNTRWDYYLNPKNAIFGRYSYARYTEQAPGAFGEEAGGPNFGNYAGSSYALNQSLAAGWTDTISPTVVNEFRLGYMKYHVFDVPNGYGTDPATQAGIPGLNLDKTYTSGMPYFDISDSGYGDTKLGYSLGANQCNCPLTQSERQIQFVDNLHKIVGNHSFKFGADLRYALNLRVPSDSHRAGELYFNGNQTGYVASPGSSPIDGLGLASFMLGDVNSFDRYVSSSTDAQERQKRFFWYGQDEWRITPKFTATLGVRWEMVFPETVNAAGNGATLNPATGLMYVFGVGGVSSHGIQSMNWHELAPRVGVAYQVDKKTVVRAGYGWSYNLGTFGSTFGHNVTQNPPVLDYQQINNPGNTPFATVFNLAQGPSAPQSITVGSDGTFPLPNGISPKYRPSTFTMAVVYQYNGTVQRQITNAVAVSAGYVGNSTRHGWLGTSNTTNPNESYWNFDTQQALQPYYNSYGWTQGLGYYCNCSNQQYNSFQSTVTVRALNGWTLQGNYTYQKLKTWDGPYDTNYYFIYGPQNGAGGYGDSSLIPHHQITVAQNWDIPFGHGRKFGSTISKGADLALGGWTVSAITTYYSGLPFGPYVDYYASGAVRPSTGPNNRPDSGSGAVYPSSQNRNQWIVGCPDQQCTSGPFLFPQGNTFGNYPIDTLIGPRFVNVDFSALKWFNVTEKISLGLRMDSRNFFNHTNLGNPNNDVTAPNAGQITGIAFGGNNGVGMRTLQFSATVKF
ncbi:MAG TPA: TonB-dependent receptor [Bryobacteraceae bacterium]|nr:TonB-dependent receptor [Bryobacteraceae bacterium]